MTVFWMKPQTRENMEKDPDPPYCTHAVVRFAVDAGGKVNNVDPSQ